MNRKLAVAFIFLTMTLVTYQQCSMGGEDTGSFLNLPSSGSPSSNPDQWPVVTLAHANPLVLDPATTTLTLTGVCVVGAYDYQFQLSYAENGGAGTTMQYGANACVNGLFSFDVHLPSLSIRAGHPGTLSVRIIVPRAGGTVYGDEVFLNIGWTGQPTNPGPGPGPGCTNPPDTLVFTKSCCVVRTSNTSFVCRPCHSGQPACTEYPALAQRIGPLACCPGFHNEAYEVLNGTIPDRCVSFAENRYSIQTKYRCQPD